MQKARSHTLIGAPTACKLSVSGSISLPYARVNQRPGSAIQKCPSGLSFGGYGISTVCASTTPLGLALAPG